MSRNDLVTAFKARNYKVDKAIEWYGAVYVQLEDKPEDIEEAQSWADGLKVHNKFGKICKVVIIVKK